MSAGPLLSTTWFAPDQRATATAVASLIGYLGSACSFLIGPLAVPAPNDTEKLGSTSTIYWTQNHIGDRIQFVLYAGTVYSAVCSIRRYSVVSCQSSNSIHSDSESILNYFKHLPYRKAITRKPSMVALQIPQSSVLP